MSRGFWSYPCVRNDMALATRRGLEQTLAGDILSQQFQNGFVVFLQLFDRLGTEYLLFRIVTHRYIRFENRGKSNTLAADNKTEEALRCFEGLSPHSAKR